jgi:uroporphyrinogen-III synthase
MANNAETSEHRATLLLTRPAASSVSFAARLDPVIVSRAALVISPLLEIVGLGHSVDLSGYGGVILSSVNGVMYGPQGDGMQAFCVGHQTADAAIAKGWHVAGLAQDADGLIREIETRPAKGPLLHLSGQHQRGDIAERLTALDQRTSRVVIYDQRSVALSEAAQTALCGDGPVVLPLFSPRTAAQFVRQARETRMVHAIAMSAAVAEELKGCRFADVQIVAAPTGDEMARAVALLLTNDRLP